MGSKYYTHKSSITIMGKVIFAYVQDLLKKNLASWPRYDKQTLRSMGGHNMIKKRYGAWALSDDKIRSTGMI